MNAVEHAGSGPHGGRGCPWPAGAGWRKAQPGTSVLALETGYHRDYGSAVVYKDYFASPDLMFPSLVRPGAPLKQKACVFGIRAFAAAKAWPLAAFAGGAVINDGMAGRNLVLLGDAASRTVRAYEREGQTFKAHHESGKLRRTNGAWNVTEAALIGPNGARMPRVAGHIAYWFACQMRFSGVFFLPFVE